MTKARTRHNSEDARPAYPKKDWRIPGASAFVAAVAAGLLLGACSSTKPPAKVSSGTTGPEGVVIPNGQFLASADTTVNGSTVDGIQCQTSEQVVFHIHAHLSVYVNGSPVRIPYGIGITQPRGVQQTPVGPFVSSGGCFYWLHTHAADGIIHIESPSQRTYTLGNFFDIWDQPLNSDQVATAKGTVFAYVDGRKFTGSPASIVIGDHTQVQLDVGKDVPFVPVSFGSQL